MLPVLRVLDAEGRVHEVSRGARVGPASDDVGSLLAVDTLARTAEVLGRRLRVVGVAGVPDLNIHPSLDPGPADVLVDRPGGVPAPPYGLGHRLAWLAGCSLPQADAELARWRRLVAAWAEEPSRPMCAGVQDALLDSLSDGLRTVDAVNALRASLDEGLPGGVLFETWAWADRLLGLDLAANVGR